MYVLLRGQVTVYHDYSRPTATDRLAAGPDAADTALTGDQLRQQLGSFVVTLKGESLILLTTSRTRLKLQNLLTRPVNVRPISAVNRLRRAAMSPERDMQLFFSMYIFINCIPILLRPK